MLKKSLETDDQLWKDWEAAMTGHTVRLIEKFVGVPVDHVERRKPNIQRN